MSEFQDIRIVGIDVDGISRISVDQDIFDIPFKLSSQPPQDWANIFEITSPRTWRGNPHITRLSGSCILLRARISETPEKYKEELASKVDATNEKYREHLATLKTREQREREARDAQNSQEAELKRRLSSLDFE